MVVKNVAVGVMDWVRVSALETVPTVEGVNAKKLVDSPLRASTGATVVVALLSVITEENPAPQKISAIEVARKNRFNVFLLQQLEVLMLLLFKMVPYKKGPYNKEFTV